LCKPRIIWVRPGLAPPSKKCLLVFASLDKVVRERFVQHLQKDKYYQSLFEVAASMIEADVGGASAVGGDDGAKGRHQAKRKQGKPMSFSTEHSRATQLAKKHPRTYEWGGGLVTFVPKASAWQATCPECTGGHLNKVRRSTFCRISLSFSSPAEDALVQRRMQHWLNSTYKFETRFQHQGWKPGNVPADMDLLKDQITAQTFSGDEAAGNCKDTKLPKRSCRRRRWRRGGRRQLTELQPRRRRCLLHPCRSRPLLWLTLRARARALQATRDLRAPTKWGLKKLMMKQRLMAAFVFEPLQNVAFCH
jgi:hypothetical protein